MSVKKTTCVCIGLCCSALLWGGIVEERLSAIPSAIVAPRFGAISNVSTSTKVINGTLLSEPYSLDWLEQYVDPDSKTFFSETYGETLSTLLPQSGYLFGDAVTGAGQLSLPVLLKDNRVLTLFIRGGKLTSLSLSAAQ